MASWKHLGELPHFTARKSKIDALLPFKKLEHSSCNLINIQQFKFCNLNWGNDIKNTDTVTWK